MVGNKIVQFYGGQNKQLYVLILARSTNYLMDFFIIILDYIHKYKGRNLVYGVGNKNRPPVLSYTTIRTKNLL